MASVSAVDLDLLLSECQTLMYFTKFTLRMKIRPSHVKSMVFRLLIRAVDGLFLISADHVT